MVSYRLAHLNPGVCRDMSRAMHLLLIHVHVRHRADRRGRAGRATEWSTVRMNRSGDRALGLGLGRSGGRVRVCRWLVRQRSRSAVRGGRRRKRRGDVGGSAVGIVHLDAAGEVDGGRLRSGVSLGGVAGLGLVEWIGSGTRKGVARRKTVVRRCRRVTHRAGNTPDKLGSSSRDQR